MMRNPWSTLNSVKEPADKERVIAPFIAQGEARFSCLFPRDPRVVPTAP